MILQILSITIQAFERGIFNMKLVIFAIAIVANVVLAAAEDWVPKSLQELKAIRKECMAEHPVSAEHIEKMKNFEYPDDESVRKLILCNVEKIGIFTKAEGYNPHRVVKVYKSDLDENEAIAIAEKCADKNVEKSSDDVWAFRGHVCIMDSKLGVKVKEYVRKAIESGKI